MNHIISYGHRLNNLLLILLLSLWLRSTKRGGEKTQPGDDYQFLDKFIGEKNRGSPIVAFHQSQDM